ncbi:MAG: hypothetical protein ACUVRP_06425 [Chlorobiales bacterium]
MTGNVERLLLMPAAEIALVNDAWGAKTSNTYQYGTFARRKTEDDIVSQNFIYLSLLFYLSLTLTREGGAFKMHLIIATTRLTARLLGKYVLFDDAVRLRYEIWAQPSLEDSKNLRSHIDSVLEVPLLKHLSLLASLNFTRESIVLPNVCENDALVLFGVSLLY